LFGIGRVALKQVIGPNCDRDLLAVVYVDYRKAAIARRMTTLFSMGFFERNGRCQRITPTTNSFRGFRGTRVGLV
jgi:hypothetical protein